LETPYAHGDQLLNALIAKAGETKGLHFVGWYL
jgi:hypothetical protein